MLDGKDAASRGLSAARDGDTIIGAGRVQRGRTRRSGEAQDKLESPRSRPGSRCRSSRPTSEPRAPSPRSAPISPNRARSITVSVDPDALEVVDGRLPLEEVAKVTPALEQGSAALSNALHRVDSITDDPYLAPPVRDAIDKVHGQLVQAERRGAPRRRPRPSSRPRSSVVTDRGLPARGAEQRRVACHRRLHRQLRADHRGRRQARRGRPHPHSTSGTSAARPARSRRRRPRSTTSAGTRSSRPQTHAAEREPVARLPERRRRRSPGWPRRRRGCRVDQRRRRDGGRSGRPGRAAQAHRCR